MNQINCISGKNTHAIAKQSIKKNWKHWRFKIKVNFHNITASNPNTTTHNAAQIPALTASLADSTSGFFVRLT